MRSCIIFIIFPMLFPVFISFFFPLKAMVSNLFIKDFVFSSNFQSISNLGSSPDIY